MLWRARNELLWEDSHSNVEDICCKATTVAMEFLENGIGDGDKFHQSQVDRQRTLWSPPVSGSYKVSIACHVQSGSLGTRVGILIHDHFGFVVAASGFVSQRFSDSLSLCFHILLLCFMRYS
jgi:hypothetical protein